MNNIGKFIGGINTNTKKELSNIFNCFDKNTTFLNLTSGNFNVEKILYEKGFKNIISNDISLYSCSFGALLIDKIEEIKIVNNDFLPLKKYENKSQLENMAILNTIYGAGFFDVNKNFFNLNRYIQIIKHQEEIFKKNIECFKKVKEELKIKDFIGKCFTELLEKENVVFLSFLPTYTGGYEKIYKFLDASIEWNKRKYKNINSKDYIFYNKLIIEKGGIVYTDRILDGEEQNLIKIIKNKGRDIYIYSKIEKLKELKGVLFNNKKNVFFKLDLLDSDYKFNDTDEIKVKVIKADEFNFIRQKFISSKVRILGTPQICFGCFLNNKLFGCFGYKKGYNFGDYELLSDFSTFNKNRISKLVVMLSVSKEVLKIIKYKTLSYSINNIYTKIFTDKMVSSKYRGIADLINRSDTGLLYALKMNNILPIKEIYKLWLKKYYKN